MRTTETLAADVKNGVARVTITRATVHNAFNETLIAELSQVLRDLSTEKDLRALVLTGEGKSFCAGADLNWMRKQKDATYEENVADAMELWRLLEALYRFPRPTIARVNGAAIGGGAGLVAACDIAIASELAVFSLSEVKLGLVPACISPFVLRKIGEGACRELFLTGERFFAKKALALGLVRELVPHDELDVAVEKKIELLRTSGPVAVATCKDLLLKVPRLPLSEAGPLTADIIARLRVGEEGQEGMAAFLERRKPSWAE